MAEWELKPFHSVGVLEFGDSRNAARTKVNSRFVEFMKTDDSEVTTDAFDDIILHLHYDNENKLTTIEAIPPCDLTYNGIRFGDRTVGEIVKDLKEAGLACDDELMVDKLGIAFYAPMGKVQSVSVFPSEEFAKYKKLKNEIAKRRKERKKQGYPPIPFGPQAESLDWED